MRKRLAILLLSLSCFATAAEYKATVDTVGFGPITVTITDAPCTVGLVLAQIPKEFHGAFQNGIVQGATLSRKMCWSAEVAVGELPAGHLFLIDELGDTGRLPIEAFLPEVKPEGI